MEAENDGSRARRGLVSISLLVLAVLLIPPTHEFLDSVNCWDHGGEVDEVNYWSHVICGGTVTDGYTGMSFVNQVNNSVTSVVFYIAILLSMYFGFSALFSR